MSDEPEQKKRDSQRTILARKIAKTQLLLNSVSQNIPLCVGPLKHPPLASTCPFCNHQEDLEDVMAAFSDDPLDIKITRTECGNRYYPIIAVNGDAKVLFLGPAQTRDQYAEYLDTTTNRRGDMNALFQDAPVVACSALMHAYATRNPTDTHYTCVKRFLEPEPVPCCRGCAGTKFIAEFKTVPAKVRCANILCAEQAPFEIQVCFLPQ